MVVHHLVDLFQIRLNATDARDDKRFDKKRIAIYLFFIIIGFLNQLQFFSSSAAATADDNGAITTYFQLDCSQ